MTATATEISNAEIFATNLANEILAKPKQSAKDRKTLELIQGGPSKKRTKRITKIYQHHKIHFGLSDAEAIDPAKIKAILDKIVAFISALGPLLALLGLF